MSTITRDGYHTDDDEDRAGNVIYGEDEYGNDSEIPDARVSITLGADESATMRDVIAALSSDQSLMKQCGRLITVGRAVPAPGEKTGTPTLVAVDSNYMRGLIAARIRLVKIRKTDETSRMVAAGVPGWLPATICGSAVSDELVPIRSVTGLLAGPTIGDDGNVVCAAGYHLISGQGWYLADSFTAAGSLVPASPTYAQARAAEGKIRALVAHFPWADEFGYGLWFTSLLAQLMRPTYREVPATLITATGPGCGKSYLARLIAVICHGRNPALTGWPAAGQHADVDAELKKTIVSLALSGSTCTVFDNLPIGAQFDSDTLCRCITVSTIKDRILGSNSTPTLPWWSQIIATGNGVIASGDMSQRVMTVRLASSEVNARDRPISEFSPIGDAVTYAMEHHAELLAAALTICKAYHRAGKPKQDGRSWGSFASFMGGPLAIARWVLGFDPIAINTDDNGGADPTTSALQTIASNWVEVIGHNVPTSLKNLCTRLTAGDASSDTSDLADSMLESFHQLGMHNPTAQAMSRIVTRFQGRPIQTDKGVMVLASVVDSRNKVRKWHIAPAPL